MRVVNLIADDVEGEVEVVVYAFAGTMVVVINSQRGCIGCLVVPQDEPSCISVEVMKSGGSATADAART